MRDGAQTLEGTIAAVNLWLASRAAFFLGLSSSAWTPLVLHLMDGMGGWAPGGGKMALHWCCRCQDGDLFAQNLFKNVSWENGTDKRPNNVMLLRAAVGYEEPLGLLRINRSTCVPGPVHTSCSQRSCA